MRAKYVVVGGGVMGTSIARELAFGRDPLDRPVVLLERRDLGSGSSGRSGAILRALYPMRYATIVSRSAWQVRISLGAGWPPTSHSVFTHS